MDLQRNEPPAHHPQSSITSSRHRSVLRTNLIEDWFPSYGRVVTELTHSDNRDSPRCSLHSPMVRPLRARYTSENGRDTRTVPQQLPVRSGSTRTGSLTTRDGRGCGGPSSDSGGPGKARERQVTAG